MAVWPIMPTTTVWGKPANLWFLVPIISIRVLAATGLAMWPLKIPMAPMSLLCTIPHLGTEPLMCNGVGNGSPIPYLQVRWLPSSGYEHVLFFSPNVSFFLEKKVGKWKVQRERPKTQVKTQVKKQKSHRQSSPSIVKYS